MSVFTNKTSNVCASFTHAEIFEDGAMFSIQSLLRLPFLNVEQIVNNNMSRTQVTQLYDNLLETFISGDNVQLSTDEMNLLRIVKIANDNYDKSDLRSQVRNVRQYDGGWSKLIKHTVTLHMDTGENANYRHSDYPCYLMVNANGYIHHALQGPEGGNESWTIPIVYIEQSVLSQVYSEISNFWVPAEFEDPSEPLPTLLNAELERFTGHDENGQEQNEALFLWRIRAEKRVGDPRYWFMIPEWNEGTVLQVVDLVQD